MSDQSIDMDMTMAMGEEDLLEIQMEDMEQITEQMDEMRKTYIKKLENCAKHSIIISGKYHRLLLWVII